MPEPSSSWSVFNREKRGGKHIFFISFAYRNEVQAISLMRQFQLEIATNHYFSWNALTQGWVLAFAHTISDKFPESNGLELIRIQPTLLGHDSPRKNSLKSQIQSPNSTHPSWRWWKRKQKCLGSAQLRVGDVPR